MDNIETYEKNYSPISDVFREDYNDEDFKFVMNLFLKEGCQTMANLSDALEKDDMDQIEFWVHKIAGSAEVVGASNFFPVARKLEFSIRDNSLVNEDSISYLLDEFQRIEDFIKKL
ncbi:MAG: Hpt domain-containing protein [Flavobacteriales bacterium]|nr:Hpt domain-containing protein [Flavobacteriales bacterium]